MPEVRQRKKSQTQKQNAEIVDTSSENGKNEVTKTENNLKSEKTTSNFDIRSFACVFLLTVCGALSWVVLQQNRRFGVLEEKYQSLDRKTSSLLGMEDEMVKVSKKHQSIQLLLEGQRGSLRPQLEALEADMGRLREWASGLTEKRVQLQSSLTALQDAVGQIEARTSAISKDFANKVSSVKTDVRRMDGLQSEVETLLTKVSELEDKTALVEHGMVKRIGEALATSVDRLSSLRSASQRNTRSIEKLHQRVPELIATDQQMWERLQELESGRARLLRTVTFAGDLKPKVASIRRELGEFQPRLADLTLRIGRLAGDLLEREREIAELRQTLSNLTAVEGDLSVTAKHVHEIADIGELQKQT